MSTTSVPGAASKAGLRAPWLTMGLVAVIATLAGLLVPQLLPGEMAIEKTHHKVEAKSASKTDYVAPSIADMPNPQGMLVRLVSGTMLVLGLSVASIWLMRRWMQSQAPAGLGRREMSLVETLPLGNRCSLHLVHMGKREVLIGVDGAGIKTIVPLPKAFEEVLAEAEPLVPGG